MMLVLSVVLVFIAAWFLTWLVEKMLRKCNVMDIPNERSSHVIPTPKGGGIAIIIAIIPWCFWAYPALAMGVLLLALLSFVNDKRDIPGRYRLAVHFAITVVFLGFFPLDGSISQGILPYELDYILSIVIWVWFMNLYNFMDGIDGIAGVETLLLGTGIFLFTGEYFSLAIAAAALGFLMWNWHPARIFMGDVGSIPLGFLLGFLLLKLAAQGLWLPAIILPLYYFADATFTLLKRLYNKENVLKPHKQHFYQQAVQKGYKHSYVAAMVGLTNIGLIVVALLGGYIGIILSILITIGTIMHFRKLQ